MPADLADQHDHYLYGTPKTTGATDPFIEAALGLAKPRPHRPADFALNHGHYVRGEPRKS